MEAVHTNKYGFPQSNYINMNGNARDMSSKRKQTIHKWYLSRDVYASTPNTSNIPLT